MRSSYISRGYGHLLKALTLVSGPGVCVEVGLLDGYSMLIIGEAIRRSGQGHLYAYDLFEDYPYTHATYDAIADRITRFNLDKVVTLRRNDAIAAAADFDDLTLAMVHIDISNTGEIVRQAIEAWDSKLKPGGLLLFEGGSPLRDEVGWMKTFNRKAIFPELCSNSLLRENYTTTVLHPFPSMVLCSKNPTTDTAVQKELGFDLAEGRSLHGEIAEEELLRDLFPNA